MIVSDTTPVSNLIQLGLPDLPYRMWGPLTIPQAVASELDGGVDFLGNWRTACEKFIHILPVGRDPLVEQLLLSLHSGEAEALTLAIRHKASLLLCDDLDGRKLAAYHNVRVTGTLSVLLKSKSLGLIDSVTPLLDRLRKEILFRFTDDLYRQVQLLAGEIG